MTPPPYRLLTIVALAFLALDGVLFLVAGLVLANRLLLVVAGAFGVATGAVMLAWRRQRRLHRGIAEDRTELANHARAMRDVISGQ